MTEELTVEQIASAVETAQQLAIKPALADDGREFYVLYTSRARNYFPPSFPPGWTWRAVTFDNCRQAIYEPCHIEDLPHGPA